jgi:hypothetical protein
MMDWQCICVPAQLVGLAKGEAYCDGDAGTRCQSLVAFIFKARILLVTSSSYYATWTFMVVPIIVSLLLFYTKALADSNLLPRQIFGKMQTVASVPNNVSPALGQHTEALTELNEDAIFDAGLK